MLTRIILLVSEFLFDIAYRVEGHNGYDEGVTFGSICPAKCCGGHQCRYRYCVRCEA